MAEKENEFKWYVLRTIGGKEKKVKEYIELHIKQGHLGDGLVSQVLIPSDKVFQIRNGKKVNRERIFYPGYVFIEAQLVGETEHILINIPNVIGFLSDGSKTSRKPIPLRSSEVDKMLGRFDQTLDSTEVNEEPFCIGETVKVIDGPFASFYGTIEEVNEDKKKLKVMVKIFGRKTPLELSFLQVERE